MPLSIPVEVEHSLMDIVALCNDDEYYVVKLINIS